jgi:elongation factor 1-gamma
MPVPEDVQKEARGQFLKISHVLNEHLKLNNFLVGNNISIADIAMASYYHLVFRVALDEKFRKSIPNLIRWFEFVASQAPFVKYFGRHFYVKKDWEGVTTVAAPQKPKEEKKKE